MTQELRRAIQRIAPQGDRAQPNPATPEQEARLRSLGYTAGSGGSRPLDDPRLPDPRTHVQLYDRLQAATAAQGPGLARAFEDVQEITRIDPDNPFAFGTLASMAYRFGSLPMAERAFERTLVLDPDRPGIRQNYGKLLRELSARRVRARAANRGGADVGGRLAHAREPGRDARGAEENGRGGDAGGVRPGARAEEPGGARRERPPAAGAESRAGSAGVTSAGDGRLRSRAVHRAGRRVSGRRIASPTRATRRPRHFAAIPGHPWAIAVLGHALILDGQRAQGVEYLQRAVAIRPRRPGRLGSAGLQGSKPRGRQPMPRDAVSEAKALTDRS